MAPGRVLVGEGVLTKMCRKKVKPRQVCVAVEYVIYFQYFLPSSVFLIQ